MEDQSYAFLVRSYNESTKTAIENGLYKDVIKAIKIMHSLANKRVNDLKKQGHKAKLKPDDTNVEIVVIDETTGFNDEFSVYHRNLKDNVNTPVPNLSELVDDYVGNLPWFS